MFCKIIFNSHLYYCIWCHCFSKIMDTLTWITSFIQTKWAAHLYGDNRVTTLENNLTAISAKMVSFDWRVQISSIHDWWVTTGCTSEEEVTTLLSSLTSCWTGVSSQTGQRHVSKDHHQAQNHCYQSITHTLFLAFPAMKHMENLKIDIYTLRYIYIFIYTPSFIPCTFFLHALPPQHFCL